MGSESATSSSCATYDRTLDELVASGMEQDIQQRQRLLLDPRVPVDQVGHGICHSVMHCAPADDDDDDDVLPFPTAVDRGLPSMSD